MLLLVEVILENHREADFERFLAAIRKRNEVLECYKIGGRIIRRSLKHPDKLDAGTYDPHKIVEIFERHGFIWGGKWYHYDTMHFEYRPELLPPGSK